METGPRVSIVEILNIAIFVVTGAFLVTIVIITPVLVVRSLRQGRKLQSYLKHRVSALRLKHMLEKRHIDIKAYLHRERAADIRQQAERCEACERLDDCDRFLETAPEDGEQASDFCPNRDAIKKISERYGH